MTKHQPTRGSQSCPHAPVPGTAHRDTETALRGTAWLLPAPSHGSVGGQANAAQTSSLPMAHQHGSPAKASRGERLSPGPQRVASNDSGPAFQGSMRNPDPPQKNPVLVLARPIWTPAPSIPMQARCEGERALHTAASRQEAFPSSPTPVSGPSHPSSSTSPAPSPHPTADPPAATESSNQDRAPVSPSTAKGSPTDPARWGFPQASCGEKKTIPTRPKCHQEERGLRGVQGQSWSPASVGAPCSVSTFSGKPQAEPRRPWSVLPQPLHSTSQPLGSQHCPGRLEPARLVGLVPSISGHRQSCSLRC